MFRLSKYVAQFYNQAYQTKNSINILRKEEFEKLSI